MGDYATVLSGPTSNGKEFTLYVSQGPLLIRVTGVSPSGIPFINVLTVAQSILAMPLPQVQPQEPDRRHPKAWRRICPRPCPWIMLPASAWLTTGTLRLPRAGRSLPRCS